MITVTWPYNSAEGNSFPFKEEFNSSDQFNVCLGHRRLSIIDLSQGGHQPMSYLNGRYWITYNGEIYNYLEIRHELTQKGYIFYNHTDTEVIIAAYHEWGDGCVGRFNGMWSFALLDTKENMIFCSRDRLGIKPFYYTLSNEGFVFSSEIKQILASQIVRFQQNYKVLSDFFFYTRYNSIGEDTFFEGIKELPGGHCLTINLNNRNLNNIDIRKYWDLDLSKTTYYRTDDEYAERYLELFKDSIRLRLRSDVPVGSALSGGLDSSGIVCLVAELLREQGVSGMQKTFTATSDVAAYDETDYARIVINNTNADPFFILPSVEMLLRDYRKLIWHQEELFLGTSIFAGWCVLKLARENNVIVTLDGQGSDEMMGGYRPYAAVLSQNLFMKDFPRFVKNLGSFKKLLGISNFTVLRNIVSLHFAHLVPPGLLPSAKEQSRIFKKEIWNDTILKQLNHSKLFHNIDAPFDRYSYNATKLAPLPGILQQVDRNSMAFSVESRLPFLDYRLVEYTFSLPLDQKVRNGVSKYVYRNALKKILPKEISERRTKLGFATAEPVWLRSERFSKLLLEVYNTICDNSIFNKTEIIKQFHEFIQGRRKFTTLFWSVFNYQIWLHTFYEENKFIEDRKFFINI